MKFIDIDTVIAQTTMLWDTEDSADIAIGKLLNWLQEYAPIVEMENKEAEWKEIDISNMEHNRDWQCSNCSFIIWDEPNLLEIFNYCPHCGHKMKNAIK